MASTSEEIQDSDATEVALSNQVILRRIYGELPFDDLKSCRLVNKTWNFEAGSYIRDFRQCRASVSWDNACFDLYELDQVFSNMSVVPINSLEIRVGFWRDVHTVCQRKVNLYNALLEKLSLKDVEIYWSNPVEYLRWDCPAISFVVTLFREKLSTSHKIKLQGFTTAFGQHCALGWTPLLPKLRVLEAVEMEDAFENVILKIVDGAPNLKKLRGFIKPAQLVLLPEDKYALLDHFWLTEINSDEEEEKCWKLAEAAEASPALTELHCRLPNERQYCQCFFYLLEKLVTSGSETVVRIEVDINILDVPLTVFTSTALVNLKTLYISTLYNPPPGRIQSVLRSIDYPKLMPVLHYVVIICYDNDLYLDQDELEQLGHDVAPITPKYTETVTKLCLEVYTEELPFEEFSLIYPKVHEIVVSQPFGSRIKVPFEDLWAVNWPLLESVYLIENQLAPDRNYDAAFLGINPEELELLKELDDESLEKMNIVPVRPSVLTMPRLKLLKIEFSKSYSRNGSFESDQAFLSKLTGILAFRRLTIMGVQTKLVCSTPEIASRLNHLAPFTSVTTSGIDLTRGMLERRIHTDLPRWCKSVLGYCLLFGILLLTLEVIRWINNVLH